MIRQYELVERVKAYDPTADEGALNRAYVFSLKAHGAQIRASGDPYFSHPLEVAGILTGLKLDCDTIVTALLHDTVEDTLASLDEIESHFGSPVARLVDGVTKLSQLELQSDQTKHAENFRKFVLAMSKDIRVLLVKLADRLHNMRTLSFIDNDDRRRRIANETMDIYAPLAERIGLQMIKDELEDLAFAEINMDARNSVQARLDFLRREGGDIVPRILEALRGMLAGHHIRAGVEGREKRLYSIWRKMEDKNIAFEQLSDIVAFRIIVDSDADCYRALGFVHGAYPMVPGKFKDYISTPKPNGYRSLHTSVMGPESQRIEIQIRTREMHEEAELGVAAHWAFKQAEAGSDGKQYRWLRELLDILDNAAGPEDFLEHTKLEMFRDQVFCFTPHGDLITLPRGATPVDFAYAVHSDIGHTCVGAKLNGRLVPLRTRLSNGDQVEIVRSTVPAPSATWEGFLVTGKARAAVRRFIRSKQRKEYETLGRAIAEKTFREMGEPFAEAVIAQALPRLKLKTEVELLVALGQGNLTGKDFGGACFPTRRRPGVASRALSLMRGRSGATKAGDAAIPIRGLEPGVAVHLADCCSPLPGDRIVGIIATGIGVTVHTIDCETLVSFGDTPERWLDLSWDHDEADSSVHVGRLSLVVANEAGSLGELASSIAKSKGNINNLKITSRSAEFFDFLVDVEVQDARHLTDVIAALRAIPCVSSVERARG
ncbi:MAG: bifunctional (p)ppGpp synthetase/guanosine-3',5'-bis(diphosphate) 3'-pyrophosphohydrolase [Alphaproteobacteria bacterium]|nr:bifunctional (p)ppGpp synthetase/guanosine-3',5'-bis(diphosphate) 3'-pyrophosphohydrolase [Alphaproteobacteria bacterium]